jgi:hypothetical protein
MLVVTTIRLSKGFQAWKDMVGAVRRMRIRIGLLAQPEYMHSIVGATR